MMTIVSRIAVAITTVVFMTSSMGAMAAEAKTPVAIVIDVNRIMTESLAAKNLRDQVNSLRTQLKNDVDGKEKSLRAAQEDLVKQKDSMKPEEFSAKQKDFENRVITSRKEIDSRVAGLDRAVAQAQGAIQKQLETVLIAMAGEQKANLVLPKNMILVAAQEMDFTAEALDRVNKAMPSVKVDTSAATSAMPKTATPK